MKLIEMNETQLSYLEKALRDALDACTINSPAANAISDFLGDVIDAKWLWYYKNTPKVRTVLDTLPLANGKTAEQISAERAEAIINRLG